MMRFETPRIASYLLDTPSDQCPRMLKFTFGLISWLSWCLLVTSMNFIGLDIHKKTISYCVKDISGKVQSEGKIPATRQGLWEWVSEISLPKLRQIKAPIRRVGPFQKVWIVKQQIRSASHFQRVDNWELNASRWRPAFSSHLFS